MRSECISAPVQPACHSALTQCSCSSRSRGAVFEQQASSVKRPTSQGQASSSFVDRHNQQDCRPSRLDGTQSDSRRTLFRALEHAVSPQLILMGGSMLARVTFVMDHDWSDGHTCSTCSTCSKTRTLRKTTSARRRRARHGI